MLTPKEFRMTSIPELAGFLLFFLYCIFDWPLLYIKRFSPLTGNVEITEKGLWTFLSEIDTIYFQLILYGIGVLLLFCTISTLLKGFVSKPSWAVFFHIRSISGMWLLGSIFLILPTIIARELHNYLEKDQFIIHFDYTVAPSYLTFIAGAIYVWIALYSTKQCLKCYDEYPQQVSKAVWPYLSKSWLDKHYGKNNVEVKTEKTEVPAETCTEKQSPKEETEKVIHKQERPSNEINTITTHPVNAAVEQTAQQTVTVSQTVTSSVSQSQCTPPTNKKKLGLIAGGILAVLLIAGTILYFTIYKPHTEDHDVLRTYVGATSVLLRSSQTANTKDNILKQISYGSEVITYEKGKEWSHVKADGIEGYIASSYLLNSSDYNLLNSIWGNENAKKGINTFRCRMALLDFYRQNEMTGGTEGWQIFAKDTEGLPNTITYPKLYEKEGKFANFFFIVKNNTTGQRILAGYSFKNETEQPVYRFMINVPEEGHLKKIHTQNGNVTIEFDNRQEISFPFYDTSWDEVLQQPGDSITASVINGNINLLPYREYWLEGMVGTEYKLKGTIMRNTSDGLMLNYVINDGWETGTEYGAYDNGKMTFESGIEATLTDKIVGFWKEDRYGKTCLPLELRIIGNGLFSKRNVPSPPSVPQIEDVLSESEPNNEDETFKEEKDETEIMEIPYIPPIIEEEPEDDNLVYDKVEQLPQFPGGQSALISFLSRNVKYPKVCQENGIQGTVIMQFVINKDGNISDVSVYKGVNPYLDTEATRVIKSMPKWTPGKQKGKPVNVKYTLPINFRLN